MSARRPVTTSGTSFTGIRTGVPSPIDTEQPAPFEGDDSVLLAARREDGLPVRMGILAASDLAHGVVLALEAAISGHEVLGFRPEIDRARFVAQAAQAHRERAGAPAHP